MILLEIYVKPLFLGRGGTLGGHFQQAVIDGSFLEGDELENVAAQMIQAFNRDRRIIVSYRRKGLI